MSKLLLKFGTGRRVEMDSVCKGILCVGSNGSGKSNLVRTVVRDLEDEEANLKESCCVIVVVTKPSEQDTFESYTSENEKLSIYGVNCYDDTDIDYVVNSKVAAYDNVLLIVDSADELSEVTNGSLVNCLVKANHYDNLRYILTCSDVRKLDKRFFILIKKLAIMRAHSVTQNILLGRVVVETPIRNSVLLVGGDGDYILQETIPTPLLDLV